MRKRQRPNLNKDLTSDYLSDKLDVDRAEGKQRFNRRSKFADKMRTLRTRAEQASSDAYADLPTARVVEVHGLFCTIEPVGEVAAGETRPRSTPPSAKRSSGSRRRVSSSATK